MSWANGVKSNKHRRVDAALGMPAGVYIRELRERGMPWRAIALMLAEDAGEPIPAIDSTLRDWARWEEQGWGPEKAATVVPPGHFGSRVPAV